MRIIPKKTKVKMEFFKNVTVADVLVGIVYVVLLLCVILSNFDYKFPIITVILVIAVTTFLKFDGLRTYQLVGRGFRFFAYRKKYDKEIQNAGNVRNIVPFLAVGDGVIDYSEYCAGVVEIKPKEFRLLSEYQQNMLIDNAFAGIIRSVSGAMRASLVKLDRPFLLDDYVAAEDAKSAELERLQREGELSEKELFIRTEVIENRKRILDDINKKNRVFRACYYLVVYDADKSAVKEFQNYTVRTMKENGVECRILNDKELAVFLKYSYTKEFDEREIDKLPPEQYMDWILPESVEFKLNKAILDGKTCFNYTVRDFPLSVVNAWGYQIFNIMGTKVVMNFSPIPKDKAIRRIDRAIDELMSQSAHKSKTSDLIDQDTHIETLVNLLAYLQNDNETLFDVTLHITVYDNSENDKKLGAKENLRKRIRRIVTESGFKLTDNFGGQVQAFLSSSVSAYEGVSDFSRSIHSSSIAAAFPFVLNSLVDERGILIGESNSFPVILDFFKRDNERVNSNMVVMGKSGSGKSFATKTLLTNLAVENSKIFILDPENEYGPLSKNMGGQAIDVGAAKEGRLNPFHIVTSLDDDESDSGGAVGNFSVHLQFLEEFFKQILVGITPDALEYLNNLVIRMYALKGIDAHMDLAKLQAEDYPIFDDLYNLIESERTEATDEYVRKNLTILENYINKFSGEGRNANLWNGASTLAARENFTVFNFQTLLANKNNTVANAQMLLVLKWLDNEIIKNREFNLKHGTDRKIIVVIDEAHVFIDTKYPIALDFMFQLAKRIRKYNGMQIIITQNIKDFVGSEEIARKSTAIINACQYSFIFALAPNDMDDLCSLYEKAGEINETEQEEIINNGRGNAFLITSPLNRSNVAILASPFVKKVFETEF